MSTLKATYLQHMGSPDPNITLDNTGGVTFDSDVVVSGDIDASNIAYRLTTNTTFHVTTSGNDVSGDGSSANPWATPHRAMDYLSEFLITDGVEVVIAVADGEYTFTQQLNLNHPNGTQITISGESVTGTRPTGDAAAPHTLNGGGTTTANRGNTSSSETYNDALLKGYYNTVWQFNGCNGLVCQGNGGVTVNRVLIRGDGTTANTYGVFCGTTYVTGGVKKCAEGSITLGDQVAIHNWSGPSLLVFNGHVAGQYVTISNGNAHGMFVNRSGSIAIGNATITNTVQNAAQTFYGGSIYINDSYFFNGSNRGVMTDNGGHIESRNCTINNFAQNAIRTNVGGNIRCRDCTLLNISASCLMTNFGGSIEAANTTISGGDTNGVLVNYGGNMAVDSVSVLECSGNGILVLGGGTIRPTNATISGSGDEDLKATGAGFILINGSTSYTTITPALNTIGNGNALIADNIP